MHTSRLLVSAACGSGLAALSAPSSRPSLAAPAVTVHCDLVKGFFSPKFSVVESRNPKENGGCFFPKMMGKSWPVRDNCQFPKWVVCRSFDMFFDSYAPLLMLWISMLCMQPGSPS